MNEQQAFSRRRLLAGGALVAAAGALAAVLATRGRDDAGRVAPPPGLRPAPRPRVAPDIAFRGMDAATLGLDAFRGKPTALIFWATWCQICYGEMPKLARLQADLAGRAHVAPIAIDAEGDRRVWDYLRRRGLDDLEAYADPEGAAARTFGVAGVPVAFLLDAEGRIVAHGAGRIDWDDPAGRRYLANL